MSRFRRVVHSVASGYALLIATAIYALVSWPLAMHYLSDQRFGLWGLMASIAGYLSLIDLGMSGSVARLLIDHKDDPGKGTYGGLIQTGWLVLAAQAAIIFVVGFSLAPWLSDLLHIQKPGVAESAELRTEFIALMRWQTAALALTFVTRIFSHLLQAHQRIDIYNYSLITALLLNFGLLWFFFRMGQGVFSLAWAALISSFCGAMVCVAACLRLRLFPRAGTWGKPSWIHFREMFDYGKDLFLVAVGTQLIVASQSMIITRTLGLTAAGMWYAGTRAFNLVSQAIWRVSDVSAPAFAEMMVRGERALLLERYRTVAILTASLSGFCAVTYALCNSLFVQVVADWTHHPIHWPPLNDLLLSLWMIVMAVLHCHNIFVLMTKKIAFMRYIYFIEGVVFISSALLTAKEGGLPAIILCSVICSTCFSAAYGVRRVSRYFDLPLREVALRWLWPAAKELLLFVPVAVLLWWLSQPLQQPVFRLAFHSVIGGAVGAYLFLRFGLTPRIQQELIGRAPGAVSSALRRIL